MLYEHVPDWIRATGAYKWLAGPALPYIPVWNHLWALFAEFAVLALAQRIRKRIRPSGESPGAARATHQPHASFRLQTQANGCGRYLFYPFLMLHAAWFLLTWPVLDGGVVFYYTSAMWAFAPLCLGIAMLVVNWRVLQRHRRLTSLA